MEFYACPWFDTISPQKWTSTLHLFTVLTPPTSKNGAHHIFPILTQLATKKTLKPHRLARRQRQKQQEKTIPWPSDSLFNPRLREEYVSCIACSPAPPAAHDCISCAAFAGARVARTSRAFANAAARIPSIACITCIPMPGCCGGDAPQVQSCSRHVGRPYRGLPAAL